MALLDISHKACKSGIDKRGSGHPGGHPRLASDTFPAKNANTSEALGESLRNVKPMLQEGLGIRPKGFV